ncbi:hypothetical protein C8J57DRAFT_1384051 [Mycena rebaudengoi]|nr:hypothetical protein C8J57DRAFT_1384051 [Mycena rebaudengoi]
MKEYLFVLLASLPLVTPWTARNTVAETDCTVLAWVRAQDLAPDFISRGELRVKVMQPPCFKKVASVALRLQLKEFGEVKYLRQGAVIPEIQQADNQTIPDDYADWMGTVDAVYDYQPRDNAMSDPNLWVIKAEERQAWSTEALLIDNNPNFSQPIIAPFIVASPAVNYPPVASTWSSWVSSEPLSRHSFSDFGYVYVALVTFTDGRIVEVPAGHTTFVPTFPARSTQAPFTWNVTFTDAEANAESPQQVKRLEELERCLPKAQRSTFIGEITLDEGKIMRRGQLLKGKVVVHATSGSTTMSDMYVNLKPVRNDHWAHQQAVAGGDNDFYASTRHRLSGSQSALGAESDQYASIFDKSDKYRLSSFSSSYGPLTAAKNSLDFELKVPSDALIDFMSYYGGVETMLHFSLTTLYSKSVAECMKTVDRLGAASYELEDETSADDAEKTEEGLWDAYTRVGQPRMSHNAWQRQLRLQADTTVPLVTDIVSSSPVEHYLKPGVPAPVLRSSQVAITFPISQPVFTEEPFVDTSARLLRSGSSDPYMTSRGFMNMSKLMSNDVPNPTKGYRAGTYAGLLWRKKIVAEERGITGKPRYQDGSSQHPFAATP